VAVALLAVGAVEASAATKAVLVKDIDPGAANSLPRELTNVGGTLFFTVSEDGVVAEGGLWKSDGTASGTKLVKDIDAFGLTNFGGTLYFVARDATHGAELWKSDGTTAGTKMVKDINPWGDSLPGEFTDVNGTLFFIANDCCNPEPDVIDPGHGHELWKSDGTAAGTTLVKDIWPGTPSSHPRFLTNVDGTLFLHALDGTTGHELWKSDGTAAGTTLVKDIVPGSYTWGDWRPFPVSLTNVDGTLFFVADEMSTGHELWKSDGTASGTTLVKDITPGPEGSVWSARLYERTLVNVAGTLFFAADDWTNGVELWKSDGTAAGTTLVKDINSASNSSSPSDLVDVGGKAVFNAYDGSHGIEPWASDGTAAGTGLIKDINPGPESSYSYFPGDYPRGRPDTRTNVNGTLFFAANNGTVGYELWKSDGTAAGTSFVTDIKPGPEGSNPGGLTDVNGTLFFQAEDGIHGFELWKTKPPIRKAKRKPRTR
jgi:trimeric autotransporter adhesin